MLQIGESRRSLGAQQRLATVKKATKYVLIGDQLYHKVVDKVLHQVLWQDEIQDCLTACHEEGCGGHFSVEITKRKVIQAQLTWPSLNRDVVHWCRSCHACQAF